MLSLGSQTPALHFHHDFVALYSWLPGLHITVQNLVPPYELHDLVPPTGPSGLWQSGPAKTEIVTLKDESKSFTLPHFFMVCNLIDDRNDAIKCSKSKWNYETQASGFTAKFWTFYGFISMVYKSADHGNVWSIRFFTITRTIFSGISFILRCEIVKTKSARALRCESRHFHGLYSHRP